jgi:hypothetical protein
MATDSARELATALCRFCFVALCKAHLVELYRDLPTFPQYTCHHKPASHPPQDSGRRAAASPRPAPRGEREPEPLLAPRLAPGLGAI